MPPQRLARLCYGQLSRIAPLTVYQLEYGAVRLRAAGESAGEVVGELRALLEEPAVSPWRSGSRPRATGERARPHRFVRDKDLTAVDRGGKYSGKLPADKWVEILPSETRRVMPLLTKRYGKRLVLLRFRGTRYAAVLAVP